MKRKQKTRQHKLTKRQIQFCHEYVIDCNAMQACIRAGYSEAAAHVQSAKLMKHPMIISKIEQLRMPGVARAVATRERVIQELSSIALGDIRKFYDKDGRLIPIHKLDDDSAAAISSMEVDEITMDGAAIGVLKKIKRYDKNKALEMLGRHFGLWQEPEKPPAVGPGLVVQIIGGGVVNDGNNRVVSYVPVSLPGPEKET